eukprot:sb/3473327/
MGNEHSNSKLSPEELRELEDATYFDKKELQKWFREFMKDCPSGTLSKDDFVRIYQQFFPHGDPSQFASHVFKKFDSNANGCITFKEFIMALSVTSKGTLDEKLDWAFSLYDLDGDGPFLPFPGLSQSSPSQVYNTPSSPHHVYHNLSSQVHQ